MKKILFAMSALASSLCANYIESNSYIHIGTEFFKSYAEDRYLDSFKTIGIGKKNLIEDEHYLDVALTVKFHPVMLAKEVSIAYEYHPNAIPWAFAGVGGAYSHYKDIYNNDFLEIDPLLKVGFKDFLYDEFIQIQYFPVRKTIALSGGILF